MDSTTSPRAAGDVAAGAPGVTVLCVDDDRGYLDLLERLLASADRLTVRTTTDPAAALEQLDAVDCVVSDYEMPTMDGHELLAGVRERDPELPFVLLTGYSDPDIAEPVLAQARTDYLEKAAVATTADLLASRVTALVEHRRAASLARRSLAAVQAVTGGVAIADPDGRFAFADRSFERRVGREPGDLEGVPWRSVYTDAEVDRIEGNRLDAVADGWRWSGTCVARRADGSTVELPTTVTGLDDGSLVFAVAGEGD